MPGDICEKSVGPLSCLLLPLLGQPQVPLKWRRWGARERAETEGSMCPLISELRELNHSSSSSSSRTQEKGAEALPGLAPTCDWAQTA